MKTRRLNVGENVKKLKKRNNTIYLININQINQIDLNKKKIR